MRLVVVTLNGNGDRLLSLQAAPKPQKRRATLDSHTSHEVQRHRRGTDDAVPKNSYYRGESEGNTAQSSSDAPSMPSSLVNVAEQRTMARPMAPIQSSFSFSVSAHIK